MTSKRLFCFGYGYTAQAMARRLRAQGWAISGTTRDPAKADALRKQGVDPVVWSGGPLDPDILKGATAILISTPPNEDGCPAFAAADQIAAAKGIQWIGYLSSNGVYGDHDGAWVDEDSALKPTTTRGKNRVRAEAQWAGHQVAFGLPFAIFRLPGIYGPGRSALDGVRHGTAQRIYKEGQAFSRAHVDDIAAVLELSLNNPSAGDLFNVADDEPAPPQDVTAYACELLGVEPPPLIALEDANLSDMGRSFYSENKRVSNALMKERLNAKLAYPTYREGLEAILAGESTA